MKRITLLFTAIVLSVSMLAQSRSELYEQFKQSCDNIDTAAMKSIIDKWEAKLPNDAELFRLYSDYYFFLSRSEIMTLSPVPPQDDDTEYITGIDSLGNEIYIFSQISFDDSLLALSLDKLKEGIIKFPDRLDFRFRRANLFYLADSVGATIDILKDAVTYSKINNNKWLLALDEPVGNGEEYFTESIQGYFGDLYEDNFLDYGRRLMEHAVKAYPDNIKFLNDIAVVKYADGDIEGALSGFIAIHKKAPDDMLVVNNIAYLYEKQGDIANAIKYYKLLIEGNDKEYQEIGKKAVEELSAKLPK